MSVNLRNVPTEDLQAELERRRFSRKSKARYRWTCRRCGLVYIAGQKEITIWGYNSNAYCRACVPPSDYRAASDLGPMRMSEELAEERD